MKKKRKLLLLLTFCIPAVLLSCLLGWILLSGKPDPIAIVTLKESAEEGTTDISDGESPGEGYPVSIQESETEPEEPPATPEPFQEYDVTLMALGDNLLHMGIVYTGLMEDGTYDYSCLFEDISDYLDAADIRVINQETILGGNELGFSGYPRFNSPTEVGDAIVAAGFNVVLHATNHAADQGVAGILNCVDFWSNYPEVLMAGITGEKESSAKEILEEGSEKEENSAEESSKEEGSEEESPEEESSDIPLLTVGDITFAILNYTYGPNMATLPSGLRGHLNMLCDYNEKNGAIDFTKLNPQVIEDIQEARQLADIVIVFPHWGTEYQTKPSSYQKTFAKEMTEAGADLIIGTHPHVPQPVEWVESENGNRALCFYSLGNYVSTQKQALCMLEGMAWVTFHVTEAGVSLSEEGTGILPLVCHYKSGPVRLQHIYPLEAYTEELAAAHGIRNYGGVVLRLSDLQTWSQEIFGDWVLTSEEILSR